MWLILFEWTVWLVVISWHICVCIDFSAAAAAAVAGVFRCRCCVATVFVVGRGYWKWCCCCRYYFNVQAYARTITHSPRPATTSPPFNHAHIDKWYFVHRCIYNGRCVNKCVRCAHKIRIYNLFLIGCMSAFDGMADQKLSAQWGKIRFFSHQPFAQ